MATLGETYDHGPHLTSAEYVDGLRAMTSSGKLTDLFRRLLIAQHAFPGHAATASQLAERTGGRSWRGVNASYGNGGNTFHTLSGCLRPKTNGRPAWYQIWSTARSRGGGSYDWIMRPALAEALEELEWVAASTSQVAEEVSGTFPEGAVATVRVNRFERDPAARAACLRVYGTVCRCCGFDFGDRYGLDFDGLIAVHHLDPMALGLRETDPVRDLVPVCFNCHAVMHRRRPDPYTVNEVRGLLGLPPT